MGMQQHSKKHLVLILNMAIVLGTLFHPLSVYAKELEWDFEYVGKEQEFIVPYSGIYQFEAAGAQGGNATNAGGKGGKVTASVKLKKGEKVVITVGGQGGYNGGGAGTVSNGGGATDVRLAGNQLSDRIVVAGGGGGANAGYGGGEGGVANPGTSEPGIGASSSEGAGGGGGYYGGISGTQRVVEHVHDGNAETGGNCYSPIYHKHSGSTAGGGCYTVPVYHNHSDECYEEGYWCEWGAPYLAGGTPQAWVANCGCGATSVSSHASGCSTGKHKYNRGELQCEKSESATIDSYSLGCGKKTNTVIGYNLECDKTYDEYVVTQASGGSNWYDSSICTNGKSETGIQEGNGMCRVKVLSMYNLFYNSTACQSVYYGESKVKKIYFNGTLIYKE